jgi:hypothetical protein
MCGLYASRRRPRCWSPSRCLCWLPPHPPYRRARPRQRRWRTSSPGATRSPSRTRGCSVRSNFSTARTWRTASRRGVSAACTSGSAASRGSHRSPRYRTNSAPARRSTRHRQRYSRRRPTSVRAHNTPSSSAMLPNPFGHKFCARQAMGYHALSRECTDQGRAGIDIRLLHLLFLLAHVSFILLTFPFSPLSSHQTLLQLPRLKHFNAFHQHIANSKSGKDHKRMRQFGDDGEKTSGNNLDRNRTETRRGTTVRKGTKQSKK